MYKSLKFADVTNQYNGKYVKSGVLTEGASVAASINIVTMYEAVKYAAIHDQQNESSVEAQVLPKWYSGTDDKMW